MATLERQNHRIITITPSHSPTLKTRTTVTPQKPVINPKFLTNDLENLKRTNKILTKQRNLLSYTSTVNKPYIRELSDFEISELKKLNKFELFTVVKENTIKGILRKTGEKEFKRNYRLSEEEFIQAIGTLDKENLINKVDFGVMMNHSKIENLKEIKDSSKKNSYLLQRNYSNSYKNNGEQIILRGHSKENKWKARKISQWQEQDNHKINPVIFQPKKSILNSDYKFSKRRDQSFNLPSRRKSLAPRIREQRLSVLQRRTRLSLAPKMSSSSTRIASAFRKRKGPLAYDSQSTFRNGKVIAYPDKSNRGEIQFSLIKFYNLFFLGNNKEKSSYEMTRDDYEKIITSENRFKNDFTFDFDAVKKEIRTPRKSTPAKINRRLFEGKDTRFSIKKKSPKFKEPSPFRIKKASVLNNRLSTTNKKSPVEEKKRTRTKVPKLPLERLSTSPPLNKQLFVNRRSTTANILKRTPKSHNNLENLENRGMRRHSSLAPNSSLFLSRKDLQNATSFQYEPDNTPTYDSFLRNKYNGGRGGSNAKEIHNDEEKAKIYYALPKDFYEREYVTLDPNFDRNSRNFKPRYKGSKLEGAIEESGVFEGKRVTPGDRIFRSLAYGNE